MIIKARGWASRKMTLCVGITGSPRALLGSETTTTVTTTWTSTDERKKKRREKERERESVCVCLYYSKITYGYLMLDPVSARIMNNTKL